MTKVRAAVTEVFGPVNLREMVTPERLAELIMEVRKRVEGRDAEERRNHKWLPYLLPPPDLESFVLQESGMEPAGVFDSQTSADPSSGAINPSLRRLIDETSDLVDSPPFAHVLTLALDACFSLLVDVKLSALAFKIPPISASSARVQEIVGNHDDVRVRLASCLPIFTKQAHVIGSGTGVGTGPSGNDYLEAIDKVRDLEGLAAVVYSSNFEFEAVDAQGTVPKDQVSKDSLGGETVLVTAQSGFEEAWGRAMEQGTTDAPKA
jgi:peroxin-3